MPFFGTVAFFSATPQLMSVTNQIVKSSTGYDLELHDDENAHGFYYNFLHSFLITLAFKGHHKYSHTYTPQALTKWLQKKGLKPPGSGKAPAEAEMISKRAEELRHGRIFRNAEKSVDSFRLQLAIEDSHRLQSTPKQDSAYSGSAGRLEAKEGNELIQIGFQDPMTLFGLKTGFGPQAAEIQRVLKIGVKMNYKEKLDPQTRDAIIKYITKIDAKLVKELDVNYQKFVRRMDAQIEKIRQEPTVDMNRLKIAALLKQQGTIVYNKTKNIETRYEYLTKVNRVRAYLHAQAQMPVATP